VEIIEVLGVIALVLWIALSLALIVGLFLAVPTLRRLRNLLARLDESLERSEGKIEPVMEHLRRSADNVDYVTTALRSDVETMGDTVEQAADTTLRMLERAEERASEIHGFLEVVQEEAEETFLSTASLLRALRGGGRLSGTAEGDRGERRSA
jgi:predicted PurR-regulated permease PerM